MAQGWEGANKATYFYQGQFKCEICGATGDIRKFHYIGPEECDDHIGVCKPCSEKLSITDWHGCGCGG